MTDNKVFTWEKRQAVKYTGPYHHGYFFRKSFEDCSGTAMKALAQDMLTTTEKKYEVEYTKDAQNLIAKCSVEPLQDPLLKAVFGPNSHIEHKALLDFYERNAVMHEKDAMAFVDLCVILGELERAEKFADRVKKDFEILRILKQSNGKIQSEVLRHESIKMWLEKAQKNFNVARLASLIHRLAESANGESLLRVTSELWGEGYYWDAMCLVAILTPEETTVLNFMKENIPRFLKEKDCSPLLEILNTLKSAESNSEGPVTIYNNDQLKFLDAGTVFRLIKIDICRNEKDTQSDIEKLGVRTKCSEALRFVLLTALAQFGPVEARMMAEDLMAYMRKNFPNALSDYFPNAERMLFESFIGMIADVYSAVCCVLSVVSSSTVDFEKAQKFGITNVIMAKWRRDYPDIWKATGIWPRNSFASTCHTLLNHLAFLDHILGSHNDIKGKMLKYTLRICCLFAAPEFTPLRADRRLFSDIAEEFGIPAEHSNKIGNAFAYAEPVEVAEHPVNGPTTPVHLTPDQLISSIKSQGVDPPPLPEVDRLPLSKAASTTLVSESNVTKDVAANSAEVQEEPPVVKEKVEEPREEKNKEEPPVEKTEEKPVVANKVHEEPLKKSKEVKPQSELQVKASGLVLEPKAAESMDFVPSGVKRAVARENMTAVSSPRHASPAFNAPVETLSTPDLGRVVPIVSEDGVNMMGVLEDEEMETKWEISRQELAEIIGSKHSSPGCIAQNSQESVTPVAEGSVTARSPVDQEKDQFGREGSFASKAADWNQVVQERAIETSSEAPSLNSTVDDVSPLDHSTPIVSQENLPPIHAPPSSPAETPVVCNAVSATAVQKGLNETVFAEGRLKTSSATLPKDSESSLKNQEDKQVDQQQPPTDPTPPTQASLVVAQVSTPNALDNLLSGSMKASGDASSIPASEGSGSEKNIASSSSSGCPEDVAGASVCAVRSFAVGTPAISPPPSYTVAAAPPPAYSSAPKQRFNTGGFDQSGGGGFGSFGSFGSSSGVSSGGERRNTGYSGGAPSGGGRYGQPPGGQRSGGQHGGPHHGPGGGGGQYGGHRGAGGHGGRGDGGRRNVGGGGGRGHGGGQSRGHQY